MPHRDKLLKGLEKELDKLGLGKESKGVGNLNENVKMTITPEQFAMMCGFLGPGYLENEEKPKDEPAEDFADDTFEFSDKDRVIQQVRNSMQGMRSDVFTIKEIVRSHGIYDDDRLDGAIYGLDKGMDDLITYFETGVMPKFGAPDEPEYEERYEDTGAPDTAFGIPLDEWKEDSADDNDDFDDAHFGLGGGSKEDKKEAAEIAKAQHKKYVCGLRVRYQFELDQLLELVSDVEAAGDPYEELADLKAKLKLAKMAYAKYDKECEKLNKKPKLSQSDDADDLGLGPMKYDYKAGQKVFIYETLEDYFPAEIIGHHFDYKTNMRMYKVRKPDGTKDSYEEFRVWLHKI